MNYREKIEKEKVKIGLPLIRVENLNVQKGAETILNNINLTIREGEHVALVGPNGIGKTTLLKILAGDDNYQTGEIIKNNLRCSAMFQKINLGDNSNELTILEEFWRGNPELFALKNSIDEWTHTFTSTTPNIREIKQLAEWQESFSLKGGYGLETKFREALNGLGLSHVSLDTKLLRLSGGEITKLSLAQTLVRESDILLLDEPTNHLDENATWWLGNYLKKLDKAVIVVSHNEKFLDIFTQKVVSLLPYSRSSVEYSGNYSQYLQNIKKDEVGRVKYIDKIEREIIKQKDIVERLTGGRNSRTAKSREKMVKKIEGNMPISRLNNRENLKISFEIKKPSYVDVVSIKGVMKKVGKKELDYRKLDMIIKKGEKIAITGPIGSGKSTLVKMIIGEIKPDVGQIKIGENVDLGYYSQNLEDLNDNSTVIQEIKSSTGNEIGESRIRSYLAKFLFYGDSVFKKVGILSQGEKSRLILLKLVLSKNNLLVLDEPTNHLDHQTKNLVANALKEYKGTLIFVTHEKEFIKTIGVNKVINLPL